MQDRIMPYNNGKGGSILGESTKKGRRGTGKGDEMRSLRCMDSLSGRNGGK